MRDVGADDAKADHQEAADDQLQQDHRGESWQRQPLEPQPHGLGADDHGDEQHEQAEDGDELQWQRTERGDGVHSQPPERAERPTRFAGLARRHFEGNLRARESQPGDEPAEERGPLAQPAPFGQHPAIDQLEVRGILQVVAGQPRRGAIERPRRHPVHGRFPAAVDFTASTTSQSALAPTLHHLGQQRMADVAGPRP